MLLGNTTFQTGITRKIDIGANGVIDVAFLDLDGAGSMTAGQIIRFTPTAGAAGQISWVCNTGSTLPTKYRPGNCR